MQPKIVLYAGRRIDLSSFLKSLEGRVWPDTPMTIVTASTDLGALKNDEEKLRDKKITIAYAAPTDPHGWANKVPGTPAHFADFRSEFRDLGFDLAHLDDGEAIGNHDALLAAVKAIRLAVTPTPRYTAPKPADVLGQLLNLNNKLDIVPGASGDLSFGYRGDNSGNPIGKPIPVLEIPSSGSFTEAETTYVTGWLRVCGIPACPDTLP